MASTRTSASARVRSERAASPRAAQSHEGASSLALRPLHGAIREKQRSELDYDQNATSFDRVKKRRSRARPLLGTSPRQQPEEGQFRWGLFPEAQREGVAVRATRLRCSAERHVHRQPISCLERRRKNARGEASRSPATRAASSPCRWSNTRHHPSFSMGYSTSRQAPTCGRDTQPKKTTTEETSRRSPSLASTFCRRSTTTHR